MALRLPLRVRTVAHPVAEVHRAVVLGALAGLTGAAGEALLLQPGRRAAGAVVLAAAMVLAGLAWRGFREPVLATEAAAPPRTGARRHVWRLAGIGGALLLACASVVAWGANPAAVFGLQGGLWLAAMAVLVAACAGWDPGTDRAPDPGPAWTRAEAVGFAALLALALTTYCWQLDTIPWRFHWDELIAHREALTFATGPGQSLFTTTWDGTGLPSLPFAFVGGVLRLAGPGLGGERLGVALIGALTVIPLYGLARLIAGRTAALLAGFAWATSAVAIHYSRISIVNMTTAFAWAVCCYFLLRGLQSRRPGDWAWAGLAAGLSMYTYYGTRLLPFVLAAFVAYLAVFHRAALRGRWSYLALLPVGFVAGFGPLLGYFVLYPAMWAGRGLGQLNVPPTIPTTWAGWLADWRILAPMAQANFLGLSVLPANDGCYWAPFLLPAQAVLLLLGVGVLIARWRQPGAFLVLLWAGGIVFVGGTLAGGHFVPAFNHWTPAFPAFFLALALPPALWLRALRQTSATAWRVGVVGVAGGMVALAVAGGYMYLVTYPPAVPVPDSLIAAQGRFLAALGPQTQARFVGDSWQPYERDMAATLAPTVPAGDLLNPSRALPLPGDPAHDLVFVFYPDQAVYLPVVREYYPGGQTAPVTIPRGTAVAESYRVPAAAALSRHGVLLTLTGAPGAPTVWQGQVPTVGALPEGVAVHYPVTATWSGLLYVTDPAPLRLAVAGKVGARLAVQDAPVAAGDALTVDPGWVPFRVEAALTGPAGLQLRMQQGQGAARDVPAAYLWPQAADAGLAVTFAGATGPGRIDPFIGASMLGTADSPALVGVIPELARRDPDFVPLGPRSGGGTPLRWDGEVYAEGGQYTMALRTDARARLRIDGATVLDLCANVAPPPQIPRVAPYPWHEAPVTLSRGWHTVAIDFDSTGYNNGLEWAWTRPDGVREIVPPSRLRRSAGGAPGSGDPPRGCLAR
jgi:dolichyl-phosphate-mannose-protein mannosyltransferase